MSLLEQTTARIAPLDADAQTAARARLEQLTMPHWALGRLMDLAVELAGMTASAKPRFDKRIVVVMAGDHGVVQENVSKFPQVVTMQMLANFFQGGAGINALARVAHADVAVADLGVAGQIESVPAAVKFFSKKTAPGTANMIQGPAMTREQAVQALEAGIEIALELEDYDLFGTGDMGIGNTTPSSALVAVLCGASPADVTGHGTGIDGPQHAHKVTVIRKALEVNRPNSDDGLDVLSKVGGFEIAGLAGLILGAASMRKPIVIDGFISTAAALVAHALAPASADYMIAGHASVEPGHRTALDHLNKRPLLDLGMRLGEGTGAALAFTLVEAASRLLSEVATFEEAAVAGSVGE